LAESKRVSVTPISPAPVQIAEQIRQLIMRGELTPGQELPSDPDLAKLFGVGRGAVKAALDMLVESGFLTRPSQTVRRFEVVEVDPETIGTFFSVNLGLIAGNRSGALDELLEARVLLEVPTARLAARRSSPEAVEELDRLVPGSDTSVQNEEQLRMSRLFHGALLRMADNEMLRILSEPVFTILAARFTPRPIASGYWDRVRLDHRRIAEAVREHDPEAAARAMSEHLDSVAEIYRDPD
jgi:DNA-binding FadR family transcriptional regulator